MAFGCSQIDDEKTSEPEKCTLTYNANGGSGEMKSMTGNKGSEITLAANVFTKNGYTFTEWNTKADGKGEKFADKEKIKLTANTTLYAQWNASDYKITYNLDGGTNAEGNPDGYNAESETITLQSPTKTGYTFGGWYKDSKFENKVTEIANGSTGNVTLFAQWTANTYTVIFNANDGIGDAPKNIPATYDKEFELPENTFTKIGYNFAGWNTKADDSGTKYEANTKVKNLTTENGETVTLYAQWADRGTHNIVYELNGGSHIGTQKEQFKETEDLTLGTAERIGYAFGGWYEAEDFSGTAVTSWKAGEKTEDVTLYAKWTANNYTVTFDKNANGVTGNAPAEIQTTYDVEFALPENTFTRIGYNFAGWNTKADDSGTDYEANTTVKNLTAENGATVTLYAKWKVNTYTITFNANDGTGSMTTQTFTYGIPQALNENKFTRTGYDFAGWATSANGNVTYNDKQNYSIGAENVTLYAIWRDIISFKKIQTVSITGSETWTPASKVFVSGRKLEIKAFWMSDHEVTQAEWKDVMGSAPSNMVKAYDKDGNELIGTAADNNPVNYVNWYDAIVYCNRRSIKEGLTPCYTIKDSTNPDKWGDVPTSSDDTWNAVTCDWKANGYRLPTEAEWEWAARGGENYTYAGSDDIAEVAWYYDNTNDTGTREVRTKNANGYGLYDMSGNVWEWCWDWYSDSISTDTPEAGASSGSGRCQRGGSWVDDVNRCEVANRYYRSYPYYRNNYYGLRLVRTAE